MEHKYNISVLIPTRNRPDNVLRLVQSAEDTAESPSKIGFCFYVDDDDMSNGPLEPTMADDDWKYFFYTGPQLTLSQCWNHLTEVADSDIFMLCGDDIVFRTDNWDKIVIDKFNEIPDKIAYVHGDDGYWGANFGTHGFVHRKWVDTLGYLTAPYFSCDYMDTWLNDVANMIDRRVFVPILTEHMHFVFGKAELDQTHKERMERGARDNVGEKYAQTLNERQNDARKLQAVIDEFKL